MYMSMAIRRSLDGSFFAHEQITEVWTEGFISRDGHPDCSTVSSINVLPSCFVLTIMCLFPTH
ncbi:hypothetical protein TELCIR_05167 [Teladorsagia circumcincta]|uniref:Uncharacterized protein n=1 Tax=Teladorsagia circumcincta TaxID=45464 RepID=A0A2G9URK1_TELCI|nr:hypothetical protein TELCIR_05167 [Teladorsagia circumcincta]